MFILFKCNYHYTSEFAGNTLIILVVNKWYHSAVENINGLPGGINVSVSALILALGVVSGLAVALVVEKNRDSNNIINPTIAALVGALLIGRLGYVILNYSYFQNNMKEILQISQGGFSFIGGSMGAIAALWVYVYYSGEQFGKILDAQLPVFSGAALSAWLGCWYSGCAYGIQSDNWFGLAAMDEWGIVQTRLPTQLLGLFATLAITYLALKIRERQTVAGLPSAIFFTGIFVSYFLLTYLRSDPVFISYGLRWDAWVLLGLSIISSAVVFRLRRVSL